MEHQSALRAVVTMMQGKEAAIAIYMTTVLIAIRVLVPVARVSKTMCKSKIHN